MARRTKRARAARKRAKEPKKKKAYHRRPRLAFENSPLKSPDLADQRGGWKWRRCVINSSVEDSSQSLSSIDNPMSSQLSNSQKRTRQTNDQLDSSDTSETESFSSDDGQNVVVQPIESLSAQHVETHESLPSSQTSSSSKRGAPLKTLINLSIRNRFLRLRELNYPPSVINSLFSWFGAEYTVKTPQSELLVMRVNIDDLSSIISYRSHLIPSNLQCGVLQTTEQLLQSFDRLSNSRICQGILASKEYLSKKGIFEKDNQLMRTIGDEEQTMGFIRIATREKIQYAAVFCTVLLPLTEIVCSSCLNVQSSIRERKHLTQKLSLEFDHSFCKRITTLNQVETWSPFLKEYFKEITQRKANSTKPWPAAILIFSLSMYTKLGQASYGILRNSLPLPSRSTLNELCFKIQAKPGICNNAVAAFLHREPYASIAISFDEIYFTEGLQLIKRDDGFHLIGMTTYGSWDSPDLRSVDRYFFNFSEQTDLLPIDSNLSQPTTIGPNLEGWNAPQNWMSDARATEILSNQNASEKPAKMALHFLLSSISSSTTQAIGYIETFSVTAELLKALLHRIIAIVNEIGDRIPPNTSPEMPATHPLDYVYEDSDPWERFNLFHCDWSTTEIDVPSLDIPLLERPTWLTQSEIHRSDRPKVVAICFDGSSHARSFVYQITCSISDARYFVHPSAPNQRIFCISDPIHLFKRLRNNILKSKIVLAPDLNHPTTRFPDFRTNPDIYTCPLNKDFYKSLLMLDASSSVSISPLNMACIELTPRTKMSFPLAKKLFHQRTILSLDALEDQLRRTHDLTGAYLSFAAKGVAMFANRFLSRIRSKHVLTRGHCFIAAQQLYQLYRNFVEWHRRNHQFSIALSNFFPTRNFSIPSRNTTYWGFFDNTFVSDMKMTMVGLSFLCTTVSEINLRLLTSDCVESYFSTIRECAKGGGQLNARSHRAAARRAMLLRLNLHSYIGEMIERDQPVINAILSPPTQIQEAQAHASSSATPILQTNFQIDQPASEREQSVIRYISGWVLRKLLENFHLHPIPRNFIGAKVRGLIRVTADFHLLIESLYSFCNLLLKENKTVLLAREDCHQLICRQLLLSFQESLSTIFQGDSEMANFMAEKVSGLFLVDQVKLHQKSNQKSFRNSLA